MIPINEQPYPLPVGWQWTFWGKCGKFVAGSAFKKECQGLKNNEIPFYKVGSLKFTSDAGYLFDESNTITEEIRKTLKAKLIPPNSLLFAKIGEAIKLNRRALNNVPCCIDNNLIAFVSEKILFRYAYYWSFTINLYEYTNATTVPAIRKSDLERIPIPLPPLDEQQRIVDLLDELFADLDKAKALAQGVADGSELRRAAILHRAFSGKLTELWRDEHAITLDSRQQVQLAELLLPMQTKRPTGKTFRYIDIDSIDNKRQIVREPKIIETVKAPSRASRAVESGNVLFSMVRPYLKNVAFIDESLKDCIASTGFFVCNCKANLLPEFLYRFLCFDGTINYLMQFMRGDNSPAIRKADFLSTSINLPPLDEQKEIVRLLDDLLEREQRTEELATKTLERVELMKKSILARAFRGKFKTNA